MLNITQITIEITKLIVAGIPEGELLARVIRQFPELTPVELWAVLQDATAAAEKQATGRH